MVPVLLCASLVDHGGREPEGDSDGFVIGSQINPVASLGVRAVSKKSPAEQDVVDLCVAAVLGVCDLFVLWLSEESVRHDKTLLGCPVS